MAIDELIKQLSLGQQMILAVGTGIISSGAFIFAPEYFLQRRKDKKTRQTIANYAGVPAEQINPDKASSIAQRILPRNGYLFVPVLPPVNHPLASQLTNYYRHPAGVGSEEALRLFFTEPSVVEYLSQPYPPLLARFRSKIPM